VGIFCLSGSPILVETLGFSLFELLFSQSVKGPLAIEHRTLIELSLSIVSDINNKGHQTGDETRREADQVSHFVENVRCRPKTCWRS